MGFQGQPQTGSGTSELVDMTTRYYAPSLGRFTTGDVLFGEVSSPMSLNRFAYAGASRVTYTDHSGMYWMVGNGEERTQYETAAYGGYTQTGSWPYASCHARCGSDPLDQYGEDFDPYDYQDWVDEHLDDINAAADAFDVPPSVITGATVNEFWNDSDQSLSDGTKALGCEAPGVRCLGRLVAKLNGDCEKASYGPGQIQKRRARLVDSAVHQLLGDIEKCAWLFHCWHTDDAHLVSRLRDERTNNYYTAVYLATRPRSSLGLLLLATVAGCSDSPTSGQLANSGPNAVFETPMGASVALHEAFSEQDWIRVEAIGGPEAARWLMDHQPDSALEGSSGYLPCEERPEGFLCYWTYIRTEGQVQFRFAYLVTVVPSGDAYRVQSVRLSRAE
jgi:RHS repeat-associated protein